MSKPETANPLGGPQVSSKPPKPKTNVYTMMLMVGFFAVCTGIALLYFELKEYGEYPWWEVPADVKAQATAPQ